MVSLDSITAVILGHVVLYAGQRKGSWEARVPGPRHIALNNTAMQRGTVHDKTGHFQSSDHFQGPNEGAGP